MNLRRGHDGRSVERRLLTLKGMLLCFVAGFALGFLIPRKARAFRKRANQMVLFDAATPVIPHAPPSSRARGCRFKEAACTVANRACRFGARHACFACPASNKVPPGFDGSGVREIVFRHHASRSIRPRHCLAAKSVASSRYLYFPPCRARPVWMRTLTIFRLYCLFRNSAEHCSCGVTKIGCGEHFQTPHLPP